ncbi:MAG: NAD(+) synthase [Thermoanaerobaculum sp.]|nr:NAD(+) synthase [Thermoanaerobaculum sp.]
MLKLPAVDVPLLAQALAAFLAEELRASGLSRYVLGLSGGLDSAVVAALAVRGVGPERILPFALPGPTSSVESTQHAIQVAEQLGLALRLLDLGAPAQVLAQTLGCEGDRLRFGNLMARLRMTALFDQARAESALVLGTSNKSEILLGYCTLFGDQAASVQPLGDVWKTHVYALGEFLGVPQVILRKAPTADLWPGQTDAGELGFDYLEADPILYYHHDQGLGEGELAALGFPQPLVGQVLATYRRNRFKWRPTVIARVSASCVNVDRILPRNPRP